MADNTYTDFLMGGMNTKFDLIIEAIDPLRHMEADIAATKIDMDDVKLNIKVITAAVTDTNQQVQNHEQRAVKLEASAGSESFLYCKEQAVV